MQSASVIPLGNSYQKLDSYFCTGLPPLHGSTFLPHFHFGLFFLGLSPTTTLCLPTCTGLGWIMPTCQGQRSPHVISEVKFLYLEALPPAIPFESFGKKPRAPPPLRPCPACLFQWFACTPPNLKFRIWNLSSFQSATPVSPICCRPSLGGKYGGTNAATIFQGTSPRCTI